MMTRLTDEHVENAMAQHERLLLACDFDGTLCRIAPWPDLVFLPDQTREVLRQLSIQPGVACAIVSGRRIEEVEERVRLPLVYAGNHGLEIRGPGFRFEHPQAGDHVGALDGACDEIERAISTWPGAWVERKRLTATVHFRNVPADEQHRVALTVRRTLATFGSCLALRAGKRALEIRPKIDWHKGAAVEHIRQQLGFDDALCICIGDDTTDESMFRAFPDHLTVRVGWHGSSAANYFVDEPADVHRLLERVAAHAASSGLGRSADRMAIGMA